MSSSNATGTRGQAIGLQLGRAEFPIVQYGFVELCWRCNHGES
jgi:hypothetical protein